MAQVYAIGDIHGQLDLLRSAHARITADAGTDNPRIVHIGDLLDRGPDSRGVVDYLIEGQRAGRDWIVVKGNHDRFLPRLITNPEWIDSGLASGRHWLDHTGLGAAATLRSYGIDPDQPKDAIIAEARAKVPTHHVKWLKSLPNWYLDPHGLFVHAGIRPGVDIQDQAEQDLVWIRQGWLENTRDHGVLVVHGHTALDHATHYGNRLNIDSGAAYGGPLSAIVLDDDGASLLVEGGGRQPLRPGIAQ
ncbi:metallophosphoesterase [Paracoccus pacificus]|uniref:Metallophosphoesterase n=1 Tax=Paracoccus pacificus TaxID=1463598 RepID=A0ABW4RCB4_9RHOB